MQAILSFRHTENIWQPTLSRFFCALMKHISQQFYHCKVEVMQWLMPEYGVRVLRKEFQWNIYSF